ncbi:hypothetical protein E2C01_083758 [Portunus trituberculatus]|uniref:Uncharacterized protein n=1 Tax=Portunus trituberculatus TaxID=210409 RepID=A0A5B7J5P3_PORTR|nr:hypothetical protein [Portunus trituberculatus]
MTRKTHKPSLTCPPHAHAHTCPCTHTPTAPTITPRGTTHHFASSNGYLQPWGSVGAVAGSAEECKEAGRKGSRFTFLAPPPHLASPGRPERTVVDETNLGGGLIHEGRPARPPVRSTSSASLLWLSAAAAAALSVFK